MSTPKNLTQCKICNREFKSFRSVSAHISRSHDVSVSDYYSTYIDPCGGKCSTCGSQTKFDTIVNGYLKFCSTKCSNTNPESIKLRVETFIETCRKDPSIVKDKTEKRNKTLASNPHIMRQASERRLETYKSNPHIQVNSTKKHKQTLSLPEVKAKKSMALRNYYNHVNRNSSTAVCHIYLIAHLSMDIVKIGITSNLHSRFGVLQSTFGPIKIIKAVETTFDLASSLEVKMHTCFKDHCEVQPHGDGRTEWFNSIITEEAIQMLQD